MRRPGGGSAGGWWSVDEEGVVITKAQRRLSKQQIRGGGWGGGGGGSLSVDAAVRRGCGAGSSLARRARVRGAAFVRAAARRQERTGPAPYCGRKAPARLPHHHRPSCDGRSVTAVTASLCGGCHCFPLPIPGGKRVITRPVAAGRGRCASALAPSAVGPPQARLTAAPAPGRGACAARAAGFGSRRREAPGRGPSRRERRRGSVPGPGLGGAKSGSGFRRGGRRSVCRGRGLASEWRGYPLLLRVASQDVTTP